jgi:hypothetical protein
VKTPTVRVMAAAEEDLAIETVILAFAADPMARWTWPHAHQYLAAMPRMIRAFGSSAFSNGSAFCTDGYAGTALWLSPGVHSDEEGLGAVLESTVAPSLAPETILPPKPRPYSSRWPRTTRPNHIGTCR